jgi:hypothetical protein
VRRHPSHHLSPAEQTTRQGAIPWGASGHPCRHSNAPIKDESQSFLSKWSPEGPKSRQTSVMASTISSQPPMIADDLQREADVFTDLVELKSKIGRDPSERPAPREPRHHTPQFLQRGPTAAPRDDDDDFDD